MKRMISLAIVAVLVLGAFFVMYHFNGTNKDLPQAETVTTTTATATEIVTLPEITPEPIVVEVTSEPTKEEVIIEVDPITGKTYYKASSREALVDYVRKNVSATTAVDSIECVNYAASMVVDFDDPRIVGITAYDIATDNNLVVYFDRNGGRLFAWSEDSFELSSDSTKKMKTLADSKAYAAWICEEHMAVKSSNLIYEGYPNTVNYRGSFDTTKGFDLRVLKSVVLIDSGDGRYDWVLATCNDVGVQTEGGSSSGGDNPSTPTERPTATPTAEPTERPTVTPTPTPTVRPTNTPAHATEAPLVPTQTPVITRAPEKEPEHATEAPLPPTQAPVITRAPAIGPEDNGPAHAAEKDESTKQPAHAEEKAESTKQSAQSSETSDSTTQVENKNVTAPSHSVDDSSSTSGNGEKTPSLGGITF